MFETKSYAVKFHKQDVIKDKRKFLVNAFKKIHTLNVKVKKIRGDKALLAGDQKLALKKAQSEIQELRRLLQELQTEKRAVEIVHKKTGLSYVSTKASFPKILDKIRTKIREERVQVKHFQKEYKRVQDSRFKQDVIDLCKIGKVHDDNNAILKIAQIKKLEKPKAPSTPESHVGIEIEFASFVRKPELVQLLIDAGLDRYCQLHHEYIEARHGQENEYEISLTASETEFSEVSTRLCDLLNDRADANVTFGCGLHVHIDCRNRDVKKVYNNLFQIQDLLYSMMNVARRENRFARKCKTQIWYPIKREWCCEICEAQGDDCSCESRAHIPKDGQERYYGLNTWSFLKHKTLEVRVHSGTSNAKKIINWVQLLLAVADGPTIHSPVQTTTELNKAIEINSELLHYIDDRIKQFRSE